MPDPSSPVPGPAASGVPEPVLRRLAGAARLLVACDFDGTLAPIVLDPAAARALPAAAEALAALGTAPDTTVAVISGRGLADLAAVSGFDEEGARIQLVGSHGAEFDSGAGAGLDGQARALLARLREALTALADGAAGVSVEDKPAGAAVHVRRADPAVGAAMLDAVRAGPAGWAGVTVTEGKAVIDLAVVPMDKGAAMDVLRDRARATAVLFVGDDVTDERAFARLHDVDVGVKVGSGESRARYRVADPAAVAGLLGALAALRAPG